ncbi:Integral membrane protein OS=Streptomyces fumanus OX=67302 GN=GCM10018772_44390 PE=4 SV=1 [Streptomyces fumanus]
MARALRRTKEFLVAANLDPGVLRGDRPEKAIALLDPKSPGLLAKVERSLRAPDRTDDPLLLFTPFDPARARVLGDVVKVRGEMTVGAG